MTHSLLYHITLGKVLRHKPSPRTSCAPYLQPAMGRGGEKGQKSSGVGVTVTLSGHCGLAGSQQGIFEEFFPGS